MRLGITLIISLLFTVGISSQGIEFFEGSWEEALAESEKSEKLIFVDAYTTWCGPCKKMSKNTFTDETVGDYFNNNFIALKIDMDKAMGLEFRKKYPVNAYPTLYFIDSKGEVVKKTTGFRDVPKFLALGQDVFGSADFSAKYAILYDEGARDYDTVYKYVNSLNKAGKPCLKIANDYLNSDHQMTEEQHIDFLLAGLSDADSRIFDMVLDRQQVIINKHGKEVFEAALLNAANKTITKAIDNDYKVLTDEVATKLKEYDKKVGAKYELEANMKFTAAYKDYKGFKNVYSTYYKKIAKNDVQGCYLLNKLLTKHFSDIPETDDLLLTNLETLVELEPTEKAYLNIVSFYASKKRFDEAYETTELAIKSLEKKGFEVTQLKKHLTALEQKLK